MESDGLLGSIFRPFLKVGLSLKKNVLYLLRMKQKSKEVDFSVYC